MLWDHFRVRDKKRLRSIMSVARMRSTFPKSFSKNEALEAREIAPPYILHFQLLPDREKISISCWLKHLKSSAHFLCEPVKNVSSRRIFMSRRPAYNGFKKIYR